MAQCVYGDTEEEDYQFIVRFFSCATIAAGPAARTASAARPVCRAGAGERRHAAGGVANPVSHECCFDQEKAEKLLHYQEENDGCH